MQIYWYKVFMVFYCSEVLLYVWLCHCWFFFQKNFFVHVYVFSLLGLLILQDFCTLYNFTKTMFWTFYVCDLLGGVYVVWHRFLKMYSMNNIDLDISYTIKHWFLEISFLRLVLGCPVWIVLGKEKKIMDCTHWSAFSVPGFAKSLIFNHLKFKY